MILRIKKFQKRCRFKNKISHKNYHLLKGNIGFVSFDNFSIYKNQVECCRLLLKRELKKKGVVFIRCNYFIPVTRKSTGVRMGKGKGDIDFYKSFICKNQCFIELKGVSFMFGVRLLRKISYKLPYNLGLLTDKGRIYYLK